MASLSLFFFILLLLLILLVHPSSSTSRSSRSLITRTNNIKPIKLNLHHVDSSKNLTKLELLQHEIKRGRARLQRFNSMVLAASSSSSSTSEGSNHLEAPVYAGRGAYLLTLSIGTPPKSYPAVLDTGSDLIWTQCKPCSQCYDEPTPIFDPKDSSSFSEVSCSSTLCSALPSSSCHKKTCNYLYSYGDNSFTKGFLASETFTFGESKNDKVENIGFGCGEDNEGGGLDQASGVVGLGRGPLSLISQLDEPRFSYCLTSLDDSSASSTLFLGSFPNSKEDTLATTTSLLTNPKLPSFYYLPLEGISVGETRLDIDKSVFDIKENGSGGVIIDSGTTITYLEQEAYEALKKEFISQTNLPVDTSVSTGLDLCFSLPSSGSSSSEVRVPSKLVFHFKGADLELPTENFMVVDSSSSVACLAMGASSGLSIFGNVQQQNLLVEYDVQKETISFLPTQCDSL